MTGDDREQAVFGAADGCASILGAVLALAQSDHAALIRMVPSLAVGASVSMAMGLWLADTHSPRWRRIHRAAVMGSATCLGVLLPALPWLLATGALAALLSVTAVAALGILIAEIRSGPALRSYLQTFATLAASVGLALLVGSAA